jgi:hypothetical protein
VVGGSRLGAGLVATGTERRDYQLPTGSYHLKPERCGWKLYR